MRCLVDVELSTRSSVGYPICCEICEATAALPLMDPIHVCIVLPRSKRMEVARYLAQKSQIVPLKKKIRVHIVPLYIYISIYIYVSQIQCNTYRPYFPLDSGNGMILFTVGLPMI